MKEVSVRSAPPSRWQRLTFALGQSVVPFAAPRLFEVETGFEDSRLAQVVVDALAVPKHTPDLCPQKPDIYATDAFLTPPELLDLTYSFRGQLLAPAIESLFIPLKRPQRAGKAYGEKKTEVIQTTLPQPDERKRCKHGLPRGWCSICSEWEQRQKRKPKRAPHIDVFDLILPTLMPPVDGNFDNPLVFPHPLYKFQPEGVRFLAERKGALLGDEMGLGKTIQAIAAARLLFQNGTVKNGLVLCPKSVLLNWEREIRKWAGELRVIRVSGPKELRKQLWNAPAHLHLVTYDTWRQDEPDNGGRPFDLCMLDEIQRIKNPEAKTTQAVRRIEAKFRWGLSGTPLENRGDDLISIFAYLEPGLLKDEDAQSPSRVKGRIKPYFLRRRKQHVLRDLPEKVRMDRWLELEFAQRNAYDTAYNQGVVALSERGEYVTVQHIWALITKLKQICNIDIVSGESCKLDYLIDQLEIISEDDKALVFSQYPEKTLGYLEPHLAQFKPFLYHGGLSDKQREEVVRRFQEDEEHRVLLMSTRAAGLGLNLTCASYVYHFDLWWNPATARQAEDRAHRIGQQKTVFVESLLAKDTIEERIERILQEKRVLFNEVIDELSDSNVSRVLSEEKLFGLFGLKRPSR